MKPITIAIEDTKKELVRVLADSGLPAAVLVPIVKEALVALTNLSAEQYKKDLESYRKETESNVKETEG